MNQAVTTFPREAITRAATDFPTPFFLYSEARLRENCRAFRDTFQRYFPDFRPLYAVKANPNPDVLRIIRFEGFGFDASSRAEAWVVGKIGGTGMYTGNYTPADELAFAASRGFVLNLDDASMVSSLDEIGVPETLSFRINPGIGSGDRESNVLAGPDAKFGMPFEKAAAAYAAARDKGVKRFGIHMMTGSNTLDVEFFSRSVAKLFEIVAAINRETGIEIDFMNIGGGFGVPYRPEEPSLDLDAVAKGIRATFDASCAKFGLKEPVLYAEPGRYVSADMGFLVGTVRVIKDGYKKFVGIDAAANDMPRPSIYGAYHHVSVIPRDGEPRGEEIVSVVGGICENNDQFAKDRPLPACRVGDVIVIHNSGGHAYAMGHNYNGRTRHAEYLWRLDGTIENVRDAETIEDLFRGTRID
ncbi:diaminopimelate decarboxylase [bacterium]|nr:diaminopimelate decarboxylase [bacterium]